MALGWNPVLLGEPIEKDGMTIVGITCDILRRLSLRGARPTR
jgi:hypothetical protein